MLLISKTIEKMGIRTSVHQIPQFRDNFHLHVLVLGIFHKYFRVNKSKAKLKSSTIFLLIVIYSPCQYLSSSNNAPRLNGWLIFLPHFQHSVIKIMSAPQALIFIHFSPFIHPPSSVSKH